MRWPGKSPVAAREASSSRRAMPAPRESRHPTSPSRPTTSRAGCASRGRAARPDHRRPGGAAGARHRRRVSAPPACAASAPPRGRPARGHQGFHQGFPAASPLPTAASPPSRRQLDAAYVRAQRAPIVVKADGLAAGKGVVICADGRRGHRDRGGDARGPLRRGRRPSSSRSSSRARRPASSP